MQIKLTKKENQDTVDLSYFRREKRSIDEILAWCSENDCSDLWITQGLSPYISIFGKVIQLPCVPITREQWREWYDTHVLKELNAQYVRNKMLDLSVEVRMPETSKYFGKFDSNYFKYRCALSYSERRNSATFRMIKPYHITFDKINYDESTKTAIEETLKEGNQLIIFNGATGSGKALHQGTIIPTPRGNKTLKDLKIGDIIYDGEGQVTTVLEKYNPDSQKFYKIEFSNGQTVLSADNHIWEVLSLKEKHKKPKQKPFLNIQTYKAMKALTENQTEISMKEFTKKIIHKKHLKALSKDIENLYLYNENSTIIDLKKVRGKIDGKVDYIIQLLNQNFNRTMISYKEFKQWFHFLDFKDVNKKCQLGINIRFDTVNVEELINLIKNYNQLLVQLWKVVGQPIETHYTTLQMVDLLKINYRFAVLNEHQIKSTLQKVNFDPYQLGIKFAKEEITTLPKELSLTKNQFKKRYLEGLLQILPSKVRKNKVEITFNQEYQINLTQSILSSMGWESVRKEKVLTFIPESVLQIKQKRLQATKREQKQILINSITEIKGKREEYYCISVSSNLKTFLCSENYIKTHNSTTLAATINTYSQNVLDNSFLLTLEDPIENSFKPSETFHVLQQELNIDFKDFPSGIKQSLRMHPNWILVGEMRDKTSITSCIEASRSGHGIFSTFHASDVAGTVSRLMYHLDNDINLCYDLITNLGLIVSQKLIKSTNRYIVDTQYMRFNDVITKEIIDILFSGKETNIALEINKLMENKEYQRLGYIKGWSY